MVSYPGAAASAEEGCVVRIAVDSGCAWSSSYDGIGVGGDHLRCHAAAKRGRWICRCREELRSHLANKGRDGAPGHFLSRAKPVPQVRLPLANLGQNAAPTSAYLLEIQNIIDISLRIHYCHAVSCGNHRCRGFSCLNTRYRFGKDATKSFVLPERCLKSFVMPHVATHYLVSACICNKRGGGGGVID
jgi:hypothetical protein